MSRSASAPSSPPSAPLPARRGRRCWSGPVVRPSGSVSGGCVEGAVYELGQEVMDSGVPVLAALRGLRRRRVRGGAHLRRHPRRLRRDRLAADLPRARRGVRRHRGRAPGGRRHRHRPPRPVLGGPPARRPARGRRERRGRPERRPGRRGADRLTRQPARRRRGHRRRPRAARGRPHRDADLRPRRRAPRGGAAGLRGACPASPDARLRGHRLRGGRRARRLLPRLPGHRVRRAPVFATASRFPAADEVVVEWPHRYLAAEVEAGRVDPRTVVCVLTHDPKFDAPCSRWRCGCRKSPTSARWARAARTTTGSIGCVRRG